ncbi:hypothetical protein PG995_001932 [Apiospora arundinis]
MTQAILPAFALVEQNAAQLNNPVAWQRGGTRGFNGRVHEARPDSDYPFGSKKEPEAEPPRNPADSIEFVDIDSGLQCEDYPLDGYVLHQDPLVMYIPSFVKPSEAAHIIDISEPGFGPAYVENDGKVVQDAESRRSETSMPPRDQTVRCIEQRVRNIQTWQPRDKKKLETLSTQRYQVGGFFTLHYDYFAQPGQPDRASTLNVYLEANCTGGGTHFPLLPRPRDPAWCEYIECGTTGEAGEAEEPLDGVVFKPIPGNAIYWENLREDRTGYNETLHQGLPIKSGVKIGMNAWSWVFP